MQEAEAVRYAEKNDEEVSEIEDAVFESKLAEMETAMYALDYEKMLEIISELQKCKYHGTALKDYMMTAKKKVEMSDYMSAVEMVIRIKNKLSDGER